MATDEETTGSMTLAMETAAITTRRSYRTPSPSPSPVRLSRTLRKTVSKRVLLEESDSSEGDDESSKAEGNRVRIQNGHISDEYDSESSDPEGSENSEGPLRVPTYQDVLGGCTEPHPFANHNEPDDVDCDEGKTGDRSDAHAREETEEQTDDERVDVSPYKSELGRYPNSVIVLDESESSDSDVNRLIVRSEHHRIGCSPVSTTPLHRPVRVETSSRRSEQKDNDSEESEDRSSLLRSTRRNRILVISSDESSECGESPSATQRSTRTSVSQKPIHVPHTLDGFDKESSTVENLDTDAHSSYRHTEVQASDSSQTDSNESDDILRSVRRRPNLIVVSSDDESIDEDGQESSASPIQTPSKTSDKTYRSGQLDENRTVIDESHPGHFDDQKTHENAKVTVDYLPQQTALTVPDKWTNDGDMEAYDYPDSPSDDGYSPAILTYEGTPSRKLVTKLPSSIELPGTPIQPPKFRDPRPRPLRDVVNSQFLPETRSPAALRGFKKQKEELTRTLYSEYNENAFGGKLPVDLDVSWNGKLLTTAGRAHEIRSWTGDGWHYKSRIELSTKVVDDEEKLRNTLAHEMCHVAAWLIDHVSKPPHGKVFKHWASRVMKQYPDLNITTCHAYEIEYKFKFMCLDCGKVYGRHSNSIDTTRKACGVCRGSLKLQEKLRKDGTPFKSRQANKFANFVKENFKRLKEENGSKTHGQVMALLSEEYKRESSVDVADLSDRIGNLGISNIT